MLIVHAKLSKIKSSLSIINTNQHISIEMYTINKVKGLLFRAAINVITFTFLTVHRAPSFTPNPSSSARLRNLLDFWKSFFFLSLFLP